MILLRSLAIGFIVLFVFALAACASTAKQPSRPVILYITGIGSSGDCHTPSKQFPPGTNSEDPAWGWITEPLKTSTGMTDSDFFEYIYADGNDNFAVYCSAADDINLQYDAADSCWSLDDSSGNGSAIEGQAAKLHDLLKTLPGDQVTIIGHSQGGVLAAYVASHDWGDNATKKIQSIVTLDSPLKGIGWTPSSIAPAIASCRDVLLDRRYDSAQDMVSEFVLLKPNPFIQTIIYGPSSLQRPALYTVDETGHETFLPWGQYVNSDESQVLWQNAHLCVNTGNHAKLGNGTGDKDESDKVVGFITSVLLGSRPVGSIGCQESTYSIRGTVYVDSNGNGNKDADEGPSIGAAVSLEGLTSTTTDVDGTYGFFGLTSGIYTVRLTTPDGYQPTTPITVSNEVPPDRTVNFGIEALPPSPTPTSPPSVLHVSQVEASSYIPEEEGCGYVPQNVFDGTPCIWATVSGDSMGAWIHIGLDGQHELTRLRFYSFAAGDANTRIQDATLTFSDGSSQSIHLQDVGASADVPSLGQDVVIAPVLTDSVRITVDSTYPGWRYPDADILVLQELEIWGH